MYTWYPLVTCTWWLPYTESGFPLAATWDRPSPLPNHTDWATAPLLSPDSIRMQARTPFDDPSPMGLSASTAETAELVKTHNDPPYLLFTESYRFPVRMRRNLPARWLGRRPGAVSFEDTNVTRGSYYTFQVAVYVPAGKPRLENVSLEFAGFPRGLELTCFNLEGTDANNRTLHKSVTVESEHVYSLWIGVDMPASAGPGEELRGQVHFGATGVEMIYFGVGVIAEP